MSVLTPAEITYLHSQQLGRLATTGANRQPHVVPMAFRYNPDEDTIDIGGYRFSGTKKARDIGENHRVAFVVDDIASTDPWRVRMIEIRGEAEVVASGGGSIRPGFEETFVRIRPRRIVSFGIEGDNSPLAARSVT